MSRVIGGVGPSARIVGLPRIVAPVHGIIFADRLRGISRIDVSGANEAAVLGPPLDITGSPSDLGYTSVDVNAAGTLLLTTDTDVTHASPFGGGKIMACNADGSSFQYITNFALPGEGPTSHLRLSPAGDAFAFSSSNAHIHVVRTDNTGELVLDVQTSVGPSLHQTVEWSPSGDLLAYGCGTFPNSGISICSAGSGIATVVLEDGADYTGIGIPYLFGNFVLYTWETESRIIVLQTHAIPGSVGLFLFSINVDGSGVVPLIDDPTGLLAGGGSTALTSEFNTTKVSESDEIISWVIIPPDSVEEIGLITPGDPAGVRVTTITGTGGVFTARGAQPFGYSPGS